MKTLAVLSTLVGLAIAAPAPQNGFQQGGFPQSNFQSLDNAPQGIRPFDFNSETEINPVISARSHLSSKNPVIVKKKTGYHVYRDSTEERANADPRESCGKQVRVKFCDEGAKSADLRRSTKNENLALQKDDVEDSIKLAKEAVDSIQHDLKAIEHGTAGKTAQWKHGEIDKDLHLDIERASQALEHARKNIGNLESPNMRAANLVNNGALHEMRNAEIGKERLAQWKTAMENIQRNVEIARNIEDSFKSANSHSSFLNSEAFDTTKLMRSDNVGKKMETHMANKETSPVSSSRKAFEENTDMKTIEGKSERHAITEKKAETIEDMKSAASELVQQKHETHNEMHHNSEAKLAQVALNVKNQPLTLSAKAKGPGIDLDTSLRSAHSENKMSTHDKAMASNKMHSDSAHRVTLNKEMSSRTSESMHQNLATHKDESSSMKKTFESHSFDSKAHETTQHGKSVGKEWDSKITDNNLKHEKSAWTETEQKDMMMKSAEHSLKKKISQEHEIAQGAKDASLSMKSAEHSTNLKIHKDDAEQFVKNSGVSAHTDMKLADNLEIASDINIHEPLNVQLNHGVSAHIDKLKEGKSVELTKELNSEHARFVGHHKLGLGHHEHEMHGHEHGYHGHSQHGHGYGYGHGHSHGHSLGHGHGSLGHGHLGHGYHGKAADLDSAMNPSMQMEIKEFAEKSAMENMFQWKHHHHDAARSSYGLGGYGSGLNLAGSGGPGAVGVFPHAKVGGCGIPLLLSCSPSVVSGSLAKSHGYAAPAPAYRHDEESNFKNKRDIVKAKESSIKKIKDVAKTTKSNNFEKKL